MSLSNEQIVMMRHVLEKHLDNNEVIYTHDDILQHFSSYFPENTEEYLRSAIDNIPYFKEDVAFNWMRSSDMLLRLDLLIENNNVDDSIKDTAVKLKALYSKYYFGKIVYLIDNFKNIEESTFGCSLKSDKDLEFVTHLIMGHERRHSIQSDRCLKIGNKLNTEFKNRNISECNCTKKYYENIREYDANMAGKIYANMVMGYM